VATEVLIPPPWPHNTLVEWTQTAIPT